MDAPTGDAALVGASSSYDGAASYVPAASYDDATPADATLADAVAAIDFTTSAIAAAASVDGAFTYVRTTSSPGFSGIREARGDRDRC